MSYAILLLFSFVLVSYTSGITTDKNFTEIRNTLTHHDQRLKNFKSMIDVIATENLIFKNNRFRIMDNINSTLNSRFDKNATAENQSYVNKECSLLIELELKRLLPEEFMNTTLDNSFEEFLNNISVSYESIHKQLKNTKQEFIKFSRRCLWHHEQSQCLLKYKVMAEGNVIKTKLNLLESNINEIRKLIKKRLLSLKTGSAEADSITMFLRRLLYVHRCTPRI